MYIVYGWDRETDDTVVLYENDWKESALRWAKEYTSTGGKEEWDKVYVSDVYIDDIDWEGGTIRAEKIIWSCYKEPMPHEGWPDNPLEEF